MHSSKGTATEQEQRSSVYCSKPPTAVQQDPWEEKLLGSPKFSIANEFSRCTETTLGCILWVCTCVEPPPRRVDNGRKIVGAVDGWVQPGSTQISHVHRLRVIFWFEIERRKNPQQSNEAAAAYQRARLSCTNVAQITPYATTTAHTSFHGPTHPPTRDCVGVDKWHASAHVTSRQRLLLCCRLLCSRSLACSWALRSTVAVCPLPEISCLHPSALQEDSSPQTNRNFGLRRSV